MEHELYFEEGDECPTCGSCLEIEAVVNCSCHISAPCSACVNAGLVCPDCGFSYHSHPVVYTRQSVSQPTIALLEKYERPSVDLGINKRIYDFSYDSRSGSTMVYTGYYKGDVTAEDILEYFGDGTFGHRGPHLAHGKFTYTKITD